MKKIFAIIMCVGLIGCLTGCSSATIGKINIESGENGFYVQKDGSVLYAVSETFEKEYYDKGDLKDAIEAEVKEYNDSDIASVSDAISVEKVKVSGDEANMTLKFATTYDFSTYIDEYNMSEQEKFYMGTISANPFKISGELVSPDGKETIKAKEVKKMDAEIIVIDGKSKIQIEGKVLYLSEKCSVDENGIITTADINDGTSYVVFVAE